MKKASLYSTSIFILLISISSISCKKKTLDFETNTYTSQELLKPAN